jgi:hypothetical protein
LVDVDPPDAVDRLLYGWHSIPPLAVSRTAVEQNIFGDASDETGLEAFKPCFVPP